MYSEVAWVLVSSGTEVQPQIILEQEYLPDYFSVSYDHYADGLAFVTEILEGLKERLEAWKGALELKGSRVDVRKTKMMIDSENVGKITVEGAFFVLFSERCMTNIKRVSRVLDYSHVFV